MPAKTHPSCLFFTLLITAVLPSVIEIDILAPSLPNIGASFAVGTGSAQQIITFNFVGYMLCALAYGPLSEKFGIRKVLLGGILGLACSALGCYWAPSFPALLFFRVLQGMASCAVFIMVLASMPKLFDGDDLLSKFGALNAITALSIAVAPVLGNAIDQWFSWRAVFLFLALLALLSWGVNVWLFQAEALQEKRRQSLSWSVYRPFAHKKFLLPTLVLALMAGTHLTFVSSSAFVYEHFFAFSNSDYLLHYVSIIVSFVVPSFVLTPIMRCLGGEQRTERIGLGLCLFAVLCLAFFAHHALMMTLCFCVYGFGFAISSPIIFTRMMAAVPTEEGAASSMNVFVRNLICMSCLGLCSLIFEGDPRPLAFEIMGINLIVFGLWLAEQRMQSVRC